MNLIINDIDGGAVQTVVSGDPETCLAIYTDGHPVRAAILKAAETGEDQQITYNLDGEFTTRVVVGK